MATGGSTVQMNFTLLDMVDHLENLAKPVVNDLRQNKYCEYITLLLSHFGMERCLVTGSTQENTRLRRKENEGDFDYLMISGITIPSDCLEYKEYFPNFVKINGISLKDKFPDVELLDAKYLPSDLLSDMRPEAFKHMKAIYEFVSKALSINTLYVASESRRKLGICVTHYSDPNCIHLDIGKKNQGKNYEAIMQTLEQCLKDESPEIKSMTHSIIKAVCSVVDSYEQIDPYQHDTESNLKQTFGPLFGAIGQSTKETFESIIVEDKLSTSNMNKLERKFESQQIGSDSVMVQTEEECLSSADNMNFESDTNPTQTGSTPIAENRSEGEVLIQYSKKTCKNFIPVFPLLGKPKYLDEWKTRKRTSEWPPLHVIAEIYQSEFFVVAKPAINHPETDRDFCLAYNLAEIKLAKAMTGVQRSVMLIIKAFQKTVLQQFSEELTTYHWKTAVYKVSENADKSVIENKTEENILGFLQEILVFMTNSLCENYLEHYFVPSNLFAGKVEEKMFEIASIVAEIQKNPLETLRDFFVQEAVSELKYDIVSKNKINENYTDSGEHGLVRSIISLVKSFAIEEREDVRNALIDVLTKALPFFL